MLRRPPFFLLANARRVRVASTMTPLLHGKSYIAGVLLDDNARSYRVVSPLTSEPLEPEFHECTGAAVERALTLADDAFVTYRALSAEKRAEFLNRIGDEIMAIGDVLLERAHQETGLPLDRLTGERVRTVSQLRLFAEVAREASWRDARIDTALPDRKPLPRPDLRRMLQPLGPVIVFGSSNFPLAFSVAGGDTASALAAGCPVVVKAHRAHPGTSELVAGAVTRAVEACGLPGGVFSMLHGSGAEIGTALVRHPLARAAGFTGSRQAGRALFDAAAARPDPIPVFSEMSSLNPLFVLPGALRERGAQLAEGVRNSVTLGVGQFCTKPGLIFGVGGEDLQSFAETLRERFEAATPATMLHEGIAKAFSHGVEAVEKTPGVVVLATSDTEPDAMKTHGQPAVFTTDTEDFLTQPQLHEEVFGPYTLLVTAQSMKDLVRIARSLDGQLTATLHGTPEDFAAAGELISILERKVGRLVCNGYPTGVEVSPAMHHGGPYPATTDERFTSVGTAAILRWARPVCYQNFPAAALPPELRNENTVGLMRLVNGALTRDAIA
jgi:alpha-ketoglutaric semialdehyde dehydrogenase